MGPYCTPISGPSRQGCIRVERAIHSHPYQRRAGSPSTLRATQPEGELAPFGRSQVSVKTWLSRGPRCIRTIRIQLIETDWIAGCGLIVRAINRRVQIYCNVRNAGLPVFDRREGGIQFIAGGIVTDRAHNAAVRTGRISLHTPIQAAAQTDHRQDVDIHAAAQHGVSVGWLSAWKVMPVVRKPSA